MSASHAQSGRQLTFALAALAGAASAALSASAGWFLTSAALIGAMGPAAAHAFNFLAPSAAVRFFALLRTLARYGERVIGHDEVLRESARLRPALFLALAHDRDFRGRLDGGGDTASRVMRDVEVAESALVQESAPRAAAMGAAIAALVAAAFAGFAAACIVLTAFAAAAWGAPWIGDALAHRASRDVVVQRSSLRALSAAVEAGAGEVRTLRAAPQMAALIASQAQALAVSEMRVARAGAIASLLAGAVWVAALLLVLLTARTGDADWPAMISAVLASLALSEQSLPLIEAGTRRAERAMSKARVSALLKDGGGDAAARAPQAPWDIAIAGYAALGDNGRPLRPGVTFTVAPGDIVILSGRSGAGKSTLLQALLGRRAPMQGDVTIGGVAPAQRDDLSRLIAYAPQSADLLPGAVRDNLLLAAPLASDEDMWAALRQAHVADAVLRAGGLDAPIGPLGEGFSGGESRRLALARAFASQRPILLLDEPSEGLDAKAQAAIASAIRAYVSADPVRLALIVSHGDGLKLVAHRCVDLDMALAG